MIKWTFAGKIEHAVLHCMNAVLLPVSKKSLLIIACELSWRWHFENQSL